MRKTKVIQVLASLNEDELSRFELFLTSPYWRVQSETIFFFQALREYHPFLEAQPTKTNIWESLYEEQPFNEQKLYFLSSYLYKHLLDFLSLERLEGNLSTDLLIGLVHSLETHDLEKYIPRIIQDRQEHLNKNALRDDQYYLEQFRLSQISRNYQLQQQNRNQSESYETILGYLDAFYLINRFRYALAILNQLQVLKGTENPTLIQSVIGQYQEGNFDHIPILQLQYLCMQMMLQKEDDYFDRLVHGMQSYHEKVSPNDTYELYSLALNYCSRRYREGEMHFLNKMFDLYSAMIDNDIIFFGSAPRTHIFKNLVTLGLRLKKHPWVRHVIDQYGPQLPEKYRDGVVAYSQALLHFTQKDFRKALKQLVNVQFIDPFYRLNYDLLLLKIYYEVGEFNPLLARIRALSVYIERNKSLSSTVKRAYLNMGRLLRKLARYKFDKKGDLAKIENTMDGYTSLVERNWFEEKLKELR